MSHTNPRESETCAALSQRDPRGRPGFADHNASRRSANLIARRPRTGVLS